MPFYEVDEATIEALEEDVRAKFKSYEPEDVTGLKNKANELLNQVKTIEAEKTQLTADLKTSKLKTNPGKADELQQQLDDAISKKAELEKNYEALTHTVTSEKVSGEAMRLATTATKDTSKAAMLASQIKNRLQLDQGGFKVLSSDGKLTVSTTEELLGEFKKSAPFLFDGSGAAGGGANGARSGASTDVKNMSRTDFNSLNPKQQSEFSKSGGALTDE